MQGDARTTGRREQQGRRASRWPPSYCRGGWEERIISISHLSGASGEIERAREPSLVQGFFRRSTWPTAGHRGKVSRIPALQPHSSRKEPPSGGEREEPYRLKSRMSLLRAGVDMLPSCPAVNLEEKKESRAAPPPRRGGRITAGQRRRQDCTNNPAMTSPSAASRSLRPPPLPWRQGPPRGGAARSCLSQPGGRQRCHPSFLI